MSILKFFFGLGKFIFSIKKIEMIKTKITKNNLISVFTLELPKLGCLLMFSCIVFDFI